MHRLNGLRVPGRTARGARQVPRAPLPTQGVTSCGVASMRPVRRHYPSFIAHTGSWARTKPSPRLWSSLLRLVFADCHQSLLDDGPSRRYLCNLYIGAWTITPQCLLGAFAHFFPRNNGLTLDLRRSAHLNSPYSNFSRARYFGAAVIPLCSGSHTR